MSTPQVAGMHPLLSSVVHLTFKTAYKQVGCCDVTEQVFVESLNQYLSSQTNPALLNDIEHHRLWQAMMSGEVLAVEYLDQEGFLFHVRGKVQGQYVDMRLYYHTDKWQVQAVTSVHQRPFWQSRRRLLPEVALGILVLAVGTGLLLHSGSGFTKQNVENWAQQNGYRLVKAQGTDATHSTAVKTTNSNASQPSTSVSGSAKTATPAVTAKNTNPTSYSFTFKSGMSVHNISVFLQQHHLVSNAYAFDNVLHKTGVEKSIWPGTYVFKSNMNQSQLLSVLKSKPSH